MNHGKSIWLLIVLMALVIVGFSSAKEIPAGHNLGVVDSRSVIAQVANQTLVPILDENPEMTETPEERILPPVGGNAVLIFGGSVLVLIIIGGVMIFSRRKKRH